MSADTAIGNAHGEMGTAHTGITARLGDDLPWAMDTDELVALLESNGYNDAAAGREGHPTLFAFAHAVRARLTGGIPTSSPLRPPLPLRATVYRALLYLTPMIVALCAAPELRDASALATIGPLVCGWGISQGLTYVGYEALGTAGRGTAARVLAAGFGAAAAAWLVLLAVTGATWPRDHIVATAQFALFAVTAVALVTRNERAVLAATLLCWGAAAAVAAGGGGAATGALLAALLLVLAVGYAPATRRRLPRGATRWWPSGHRCVTAMWYVAIGAGQATLFVQVALRHTGLTGLPVHMIPLLVCVPMIELLLAWHQSRVSYGRARLDNLPDFRRHLARISAGTLGLLALPLLAGMMLAAAADGSATAAQGGLPVPTGTLPGAAGPAAVPDPGLGLLAGLAESVLLTAVFALCLVLAAHRRLVMACVVVWWPALLVTMVQASAGAGGLPTDAHRVIAVGLAVAGLVGMVAAARATRDPRSYA